MVTTHDHERLAQIRARLEAATPGKIYFDSEAARSLFAHAPDDLLWLLAEVERLRGVVAQMPEATVVEESGWDFSNGRAFVRRYRTIYADRVTEWERADREEQGQ